MWRCLKPKIWLDSVDTCGRRIPRVPHTPGHRRIEVLEGVCINHDMIDTFFIRTVLCLW